MSSQMAAAAAPFNSGTDGAKATSALEKFKNLLIRWNNASASDRQVMLVAVLAVVAASVIVVLLWSASQGYRPLYGAQEGFDSAEVIQVLEAEKIQYRMQADSGQILVLEDQLGRARMVLASRGIRAQIPAGMEILDKGGTLGSSQFLEEARFRQGLEGELARTIMALKSVRNARVHLAIPKRTLFIRQNPELPSAAIMVELYSGAELSREQVTGIVNLISGSISAMPLDQISVVDQSGKLLSADLEINQELSRAGDRQLTYTQNLEKNLTQRASEMLQPVLGFGNYRVQVTSRVNFDQVEETREEVDPATGAIKREITRSDQRNSDFGLGIPGALSNQAPADNDGEETQADSELTVNRESERHYELSRAVRHTRFGQAHLERLSVSVLINAEFGTQFSPQEQAQLSDLVQNAIGFSAERGDTLTLHAFPFATVVVPDIEPMPLWQSPEYQVYVRYLIGALLGLGIILFVLRPLVKHLTRTVEQEREQAAMLSPQIDSDPALLATANNALELPAPGSALSVQLEHLALLANEEPARVAEVITQWMGGQERES